MTEKNLHQKLLGEIQKSGFPLELRVSDYLTTQGYYVANNLYFVDQDEEKGREIDLRALKNITFEANREKYWVRHCLLIECKKSAEKPWVIFTSSKTDYDKHVADIDIRGTSNSNWNNASFRTEFANVHPFARYERRGRSFFEPFKSAEKGETIYKALTTVAKSTISTRDSGFAARGSSICFYYPVIVFEGELYEAFLDKNEITLSEVDSVLTSFYYQSAKYKESNFAIPIINEKTLEKFCEELQASLEYMADFCQKDISLFGK